MQLFGVFKSPWKDSLGNTDGFKSNDQWFHNKEVARVDQAIVH